MKISNIRTALLKIATATTVLVWATPARVHPHVFAEATLKVSIKPDGTVGNLAHVWRFDEAFSSTVLFEFDKDTDGKIDATEQAEISKTIVESIGEYNYFEAVTRNGVEVKMAKPANLQAKIEDTTLIITFDNAPMDVLPVQGTVTFGIYDPTFYTAIDFIEDTDLTVSGIPATCKQAVVRPDADEALASNQQSLTEAFFTDPQGTNMSKIFATRIEVTC